MTNNVILLEEVMMLYHLTEDLLTLNPGGDLGCHGLSLT